MSSKDFGLRISGTIFGIVSILHLLRLLTGASVIIAGYSLPVWVNVLGFFAGGFLCILLLWFSKNEK
jgi:hypothetical protein